MNLQMIPTHSFQDWGQGQRIRFSHEKTILATRCYNWKSLPIPSATEPQDDGRMNFFLQQNTTTALLRRLNRTPPDLPYFVKAFEPNTNSDDKNLNYV